MTYFMKNKIFLIILLLLSFLLNSCSKPRPQRQMDNYDDFEEESFEETSSDKEQYSLGLNGLYENDGHSSDTSSASDKEPVQVYSTPVVTDGLYKSYVKLDVKFLSQKPELPSGCEITSLTTVLNFYGYNVSKTDMADNYLPKSDSSKDFWKVFVGNPRYNTGFGCYAQPITDAAYKYLSEQGSTLTAYNYSGTPFEDLLLLVQSGRPVIIWGTLNMGAPYYSYKWILADGSERRWITPEHCLVLIGYDLSKGTAIISDPMRNIVEYDLDTVKSRYNALHSQCVFIC